MVNNNLRKLLFFLIFLFMFSSLFSEQKLLIYNKGNVKKIHKIVSILKNKKIPYKIMDISNQTIRREMWRELRNSFPNIRSVSFPIYSINGKFFINTSFDKVFSNYFSKKTNTLDKSFSLTLESRLALIKEFNAIYSKKMVSLNSIYEKLPNIKKRYPGKLKPTERKVALKLFNIIRKLHYLKPVFYSSFYDSETEDASLLMVANNLMSHHPPRSVYFWSQKAARGSSTGNLFKGTFYDKTYSTPFYISGWVIDPGVFSLGHRRWMLDPFLKFISYSRVDGKPLSYLRNNLKVSAATIKVIGCKEENFYTGEKLDYVAYPYLEYPSRLFDQNWFLSFSILFDKSFRWGNNKKNINYSRVQISVIEKETGKKMRVHSIVKKYNYYAIPNSLQWKVAGLEKNKSYKVFLKGILVNKKLKSYHYYFKLL